MANLNNNKMAKEQLKQIEGYNNYYVSNLGNIYSSHRIKNGEYSLVKPSKNKSGYLYANIFWAPQKRSSLRIHRLVYQHFVGCIPEGFVIDHMNDNKTDNRLSNLQLLTPKQNTKKYWDAKKQTK
jgi:hypothetical protein